MLALSTFVQYITEQAYCLGRNLSLCFFSLAFSFFVLIVWHLTPEGMSWKMEQDVKPYWPVITLLMVTCITWDSIDSYALLHDCLHRLLYYLL